MKTIEWGFLIVNYLFLGGLSAGLFFVSGLATFLYKIDEPSPYTRIARLPCRRSASRSPSAWARRSVPKVNGSPAMATSSTSSTVSSRNRPRLGPPLWYWPVECR